jgi:hypothetical protein
MGSALNFTVECIVFAAITEAAIVEVGGDVGKSKYSVFGDDIVVETKYVQAVIDRLERNGFVVNQSKSFQYGAYGFFRESCGGHFLNGVDVTPIVISRKWKAYTRTLTNTAILQIVDLCNRFFEEDYRLTRALLVSRLLELPQSLQPAFGFGHSCVHSVMADNHHLRRRWNARLQTYEVKRGVAVTPKRRERHFKEELEEFLRRGYLRLRVEEPLVVNTASAKEDTRWVSKWTPESQITDASLGWCESDAFLNAWLLSDERAKGPSI